MLTPEGIKRWRSVLGLTAAKLGEMTGYSQGYITNMERRKRAVSKPFIKRFCTTFNLQIEDLDNIN